VSQKFQNKDASLKLMAFCAEGSREDCIRVNGDKTCDKIHFRKIIKPWTDVSLGDCSYLDQCRTMATCRAVHYELDLTQEQRAKLKRMGIRGEGTDTARVNEIKVDVVEDAQWIQCDIRHLDFKVFQAVNVKVIMADPPWDIHMDLPYGTMLDEEMRKMGVGDVHDEGMLFLWVTGRAMELARECMEIWGYERVEEILWVKTNQLQRLIRTGRTGHWLNHSKEHCLVGVKGDVARTTFNKNIDCDVIVSEVRETSRKPDEVYNLIERMWPGCLKLELFGRPHNCMPNWITLGNQLNGIRVFDPTLHENLQKMSGAEFPIAVRGSKRPSAFQDGFKAGDG
jgi:mRNA (2'-O-methyladenosine-N6-)-methyltransferase